MSCFGICFGRNCCCCCGTSTMYQRDWCKTRQLEASFVPSCCPYTVTSSVVRNWYPPAACITVATSALMWAMWGAISRSIIARTAAMVLLPGTVTDASRHSTSLYVEHIFTVNVTSRAASCATAGVGVGVEVTVGLLLWHLAAGPGLAWWS